MAQQVKVPAAEAGSLSLSPSAHGGRRESPLLDMLQPPPCVPWYRHATKSDGERGRVISSIVKSRREIYSVWLHGKKDRQEMRSGKCTHPDIHLWCLKMRFRFKVSWSSCVSPITEHHSWHQLQALLQASRTLWNLSPEMSFSGWHEASPFFFLLE